MTAEDDAINVLSDLRDDVKGEIGRLDKLGVLSLQQATAVIKNTLLPTMVTICESAIELGTAMDDGGSEETQFTKEDADRIGPVIAFAIEQLRAGEIAMQKDGSALTDEQKKAWTKLRQDAEWTMNMIRDNTLMDDDEYAEQKDETDGGGAAANSGEAS